MRYKVKFVLSPEGSFFCRHGFLPFVPVQGLILSLDIGGNTFRFEVTEVEWFEKSGEFNVKLAQPQHWPPIFARTSKSVLAAAKDWH